MNAKQLLKDSIAVLQPDAEILSPKLPPVKVNPKNTPATVTVIPTHVEVVKLQRALEKIPADSSRGLGKIDLDQANPCDYWLGVLWALHSTGWPQARQIALDWSMSAPDKYIEDEWDDLWNTYDPSKQGTYGGITVASIYALAKHFDTHSLPYRSDIENGERFANKYRGEIIFPRGMKSCLAYDDSKGWQPKDYEFAVALAKEVVSDMAHEYAEALVNAPNEPTTKAMGNEVKRVGKEPHLMSMISMSRSEPGMSIELSELDTDPMLFGVQNGVIDLRTGKLLSNSPDLFVTKRANVNFDPVADAPRFEQFMIEVEPNSDKREFLLVFFAYCLTGLTTEQVWLFLLGSGSNGKSVLVELFAWLLGDYAEPIQTEMLMTQARSSSGHSADLISIMGLRFIFCNETKEGQRLDDARVKSITDGSPIKARAPHATKEVSFIPQCKLVSTGNYAPTVTDLGDGFWRRIRLVQFNQKFDDASKDKNLQDKLREEASGIFNILLDRLSKWSADGLPHVEEIINATNAYRTDQDLLNLWLEENCDVSPSLDSKIKHLYANYSEWARECNYYPLAQRRWTTQLKDHGIEKMPDKRTMRGVAIKGRNNGPNFDLEKDL
ncbi:MAG: phage/plasmid primase, P4 family [Pirellulales bacterium]